MSSVGLAGFSFLGGDKGTEVLDRGGAPLFGGEAITALGVFWTGLIGGTGSG